MPHPVYKKIVELSTTKYIVLYIYKTLKLKNKEKPAREPQEQQKVTLGVKNQTHYKI